MTTDRYQNLSAPWLPHDDLAHGALVEHRLQCVLGSVELDDLEPWRGDPAVLEGPVEGGPDAGQGAASGVAVAMSGAEAELVESQAEVERAGARPGVDEVDELDHLALESEAVGHEP